jgi:hypothetical protein
MPLRAAELEMVGMNHLAGGDGPSHDRGMEARVAVLQELAAAIKQAMVDLRQDVREANRRVDALRTALQRDFRLLFGAIISVAIGLAAMMGHGFHWL